MRCSTLLTALVFLALAAHPSSAQIEPTHKGTRLSELVKDLKSDQRVFRGSAAYRIGEIGPAAATAVEPLVERLRTDSEETVRVRAAEALGKIGPAASGAAAALSASVVGPKGQDHIPAVRRAALESLVRVSPPAEELMRVLRQSLADRDGRLREQAAKALGEIGADAKSAVQTLFSTVAGPKRDPVPAVRLMALDALLRISPESREAAEGLSMALADPDDDIARRAEQITAEPGRRVKIMPAPFIVTLRDGPTDAARRRAVRALRKLGPDARDALPVLSVAVAGPQDRSADAGVRREALETIFAIDPAAAERVTAVRSALTDPDDAVARRAADLFAGQPALAQKLLPEALADGSLADAFVRAGGPLMLDKAKLDPTLLASGLRHKDLAARLLAVDLLARLGPDARPAMPDLQRACGDPSTAVRLAALETVIGMRSAAREADVAAALRAVLTDSDPAVIRRAAKLFTDRPAIAREILPYALADGALAEAFAKVGGLEALAKAKPDAAALAAGLRHNATSVRRLAVNALADLGADARPALTDLRRACKDDQTDVRWVARATVAALDPDARFHDPDGSLLHHLPADTDLVLGLNVRTVLDFLPVQRHLLQDLRKNVKESWPLLKQFRFDPLRDMDALTLAMQTGKGDANDLRFLLLLHGRFNEVARVVASEQFGRKMCATCPSTALVVVADSKEKLTAALDRARPGRATPLPRELLRLLGRVDTKQTFWLAQAPSESSKQSIRRLADGLADRFEGLTFEIELRDKAVLALTVYSGDGATADLWRKRLAEWAAVAKAYIPIVLGNQPGFDAMTVRDLVNAWDGLRIDASQNIVSARLELSVELLDRIASLFGRRPGQ